MILTAGYILWTVQRVFLGRSETWKGLPDLNLREIFIAVPLVVLTIAMGILPQPLILSWMSPSVDRMADGVMTAREVNVPRGKIVRAAPSTRRGGTASGRSPATSRRGQFVAWRHPDQVIATLVKSELSLPRGTGRARAV